MVRAKAEGALRPALLEFRQVDFSHLAGLGVEPAEILLAEIGIISHPVLADDYVMRLDRVAWQIVLRDDHLGGGAGRTRQRLERVIPGLGFAQIDRSEELGALLLGLVASVASLSK